MTKEKLSKLQLVGENAKRKLNYCHHLTLCSPNENKFKIIQWQGHIT